MQMYSQTHAHLYIPYVWCQPFLAIHWFSRNLKLDTIVVVVLMSLNLDHSVCTSNCLLVYHTQFGIEQNIHSSQVIVRLGILAYCQHVWILMIHPFSPYENVHFPQNATNEAELHWYIDRSIMDINIHTRIENQWLAHILRCFPRS